MNLSPPLLSVVVPCFNEEQGIAACHERLSRVLRSLDAPTEILYVDDGSTDRTGEALDRLATGPVDAIDAHEPIDPHEPAIVILRLSRNFGHQAAVSAGLEHARGQATAIIDSDLQDPPELLPEMLELWRQGYQVVYGIRETRAGETAFKLFTARLFYLIINRLSDVPIPVDTGDFRLLDRRAVDALLQMPERHRLLRGMSSWIGFRQIGIRYRRHERFAGETKYPLKKMMALAIDGIVSFSTLPLRFVALIGFLSAALAFFGIVYSLAVRLFTHEWVRGWAISFIGMLFMSGVQLLSLGILGEYVARIYTESKQRPLFLLREPPSRFPHWENMHQDQHEDRYEMQSESFRGVQLPFAPARVQNLYTPAGPERQSQETAERA
jgi:dolichol-phosphate mannosyltransferase